MRKSQINEEQIEQLIKEIDSMKIKLSEFEKKYIKEDRTILKSIQKMNESILSFTAWKEWIDIIIEKIKKILPIK